MYWRTWFISTVFWALGSVVQANEDTLRVCYSSGPPLVTEKPDGGFSGLWPEVLAEITSRSKITFELEFVLRERCQIQTTGIDNGFDITIGRIYSPERYKDFYLFPIYRHFGVMHYSKTAFPDGIPASDGYGIADQTKQLLGRKFCGFFGWTYDYYIREAGFPSDWEPIRIPETSGADRHLHALDLIRAGRCEIVEMPLSATMNITAEGAFDQIGCFPLIKEGGDIIYFALARSAPHAKEIALKLYDAIVLAHEERAFNEIVAKNLLLIDRPNLTPEMHTCYQDSVVPLVSK